MNPPTAAGSPKWFDTHNHKYKLLSKAVQRFIYFEIVHSLCANEFG
jgi:phosphate starvation-inducible membrane PsiE